MINLDKEELHNLAVLSSLRLDDAQAQDFCEQISKMLEHIKELNAAQLTVSVEISKAINVFREDKIVSTDSAALFAQAPEKQECYFAVPKVLD